MALGKNIKLVRKKWRMSQDDFGALFGMNKHNISSYETSKTEPSLTFMSHLQELTGIGIYELYNKEILNSDVWGMPLKGILRDETDGETENNPVLAEPEAVYVTKNISVNPPPEHQMPEKPDSTLQLLQQQMEQVRTLLADWQYVILDLKKRVEKMENR